MTVLRLRDGARLEARHVFVDGPFVVGEIPDYAYEFSERGPGAVAVPRLVGWHARRWRTRDVVEIIGPRTVIA